MSQQKKLERILTLLVNEESEKAEELLHDLVVEKARTIYEEIVNDEDEELDEDLDEDDEEMDESIGGDPKANFVNEIEASRDDIETDELSDGEMGGEEEYDDMEGEGEEDEDGELDFSGDGEFGGEDEEHASDDPVENQVLDLQSQIAELRAEFDQLLAAEMEEPGHEGDFDDMGMGDEMEVDMVGGEADMGGYEEESMHYESIEEATKLQDNVPDPGMNKEGKLAGTGKNSKTGATQTQSPYTKAPSKSINGESAVDFTKGSAGGEYTGPKGGDSESAKDETPSDNIGEEPKAVSHGEQKTEGDFVGTGKNSKKGAVNTKSPLSTAPKKP